MQDELSTMDAVLRMLADKDDEQIDPLAKDWRNLKVHELCYDYEIASTVSRSIKAMEAEEAVQKVIRPVAFNFTQSFIVLVQGGPHRVKSYAQPFSPAGAKLCGLHLNYFLYYLA